MNTMQPTSLLYFLFFALVFLGYLLVPRKLRSLWLLGAGYFLCAAFSGITLAVLLYTTAVSWAAGLLIQRGPPPARRRWLVLGLVLTLAPLLFFKYYAFWTGLAGPLFSLLPEAAAQTLLHLVMPVGISFYSFQLVGYLVDVYRVKQPAEKNLLTYALFASFFPKLIQGPIERSDTLLPQLRALEEVRIWDTDRLRAGLVTILWGLFQKLVLADRLGVFVNAVFGNIDACGTMELIAAAFAYTLQIYLDFSGYTCMALGFAQLLGIRLLENFNTPYFATSISDFWRRWHISLSSWFRDYLYIPLGGSRVGKARHLGNLFLTMVVSGIWHGSSWNFVFWGALHGLYQVAAQLTRPARNALQQKLHVDTRPFSYRFGQMLTTFCLVAFAWIFFRAESMGQAVYYLQRLFTRWNPWVLFDGTFYGALTGVDGPVLWLGLALVLAVDLLRSRTGRSLPDWLLGQNTWFRWAFCLGLVVSVLVFGVYGVDFATSQFLYFNF